MSIKYKLEIIQTGEDADEDSNYTEEFSNIKKLLTEIFEEWTGWGWINRSDFNSDKAIYLVRFFLEINDAWNSEHVFEITNLNSLNQTINIIFNSFKNGYEKEYRIKEIQS